MTVTLRGCVQPGKNDASHWLEKFNTPYSAKLGMTIFPGSLNLVLAAAFDWFLPAYKAKVIWFGRAEYGGERDILLLPCRLTKLDNKKAFLWTPTTAAINRPDLRIVELITDVKLRDAYGLSDGSSVEFALDL